MLLNCNVKIFYVPGIHSLHILALSYIQFHIDIYSFYCCKKMGHLIIDTVYLPLLHSPCISFLIKRDITYK